jgi:hypothetical protein
MTAEPIRPPDNVPLPVIFGPSFPKLKMFLRGGRQEVESRTNQNLYLTEADFTASGTYPLHRLLEATGVWRNDVEGVDPMWVESWRETSDGGITELELVDDLDFSRCQALSLLLDYSPPSHRLFHEKYVQAHWQRQPLFTYDFDRWVRENGPASAWSVNRALAHVMLSFPALIPEVWLAIVGRDKTLEDEKYLEEHPQRVDFVAFAGGQKVVIELDGKDHYSEQDAALDEWVASEEVYTRNLRIERSLRRQGWQIHRFSNLEARTVAPGDFPSLVDGTPVAIKWRPAGVSLGLSSHLAAYDDIPF